MRIEGRALGHHRHPQETGARFDLFSAEASCLCDFQRKLDRSAAVALDVIRNNHYISSDPRPNPRLFARPLQLSEIERSRFKDCGGVYQIAHTKVEVTVHALQGCHDDPLFIRGNEVGVPFHCFLAAAGHKSLSELYMFACLTEPTNVDLYGFGQSGNCEVPFIGKPVTPATRLDVRLEALDHEDDDLLIFGR